MILSEHSMRRFFISIYLYIKGILGVKLEGVDAPSTNGTDASLVWLKKQELNFWDIYNVDKEDIIEYTNTHKDHHSNFKHLDST